MICAEIPLYTSTYSHRVNAVQRQVIGEPRHRDMR